jgi:hypothetical protein
VGGENHNHNLEFKQCDGMLAYDDLLRCDAMVRLE